MPAASSPLSLLPRTTCPHCWAGFAPEESLWISAHADLLGDARLGPDEPQRFLPTRFDVDGNALDARGLVCRHLACPKCHLGVPRGLLEMEPTFLSILGTPACGKSFFLTALTWELRRLLPLHFALSFSEPREKMLASRLEQCDNHLTSIPSVIPPRRRPVETLLDLGRVYLITFGWAIVGSISMGLGIIIALKLFAISTRGIDEWEEIRKGNMAMATVLAALVIALGIVVASITRTQ